MRFEFDQVRTGDNIRFYRELKVWTQTKLGSEIGKTESSIRKYENGETEIPITVVIEISNALGVHPEWILSWSLEAKNEA